MNQVDVASASRYLGNLGASITTSTTTVASTEGSNDGGEGSVRLHLLISLKHTVLDLVHLLA